MLPVLLLLVAGGADLARAYFLGVELQDGVRSAALYAASNPASPPSNVALEQLVAASVTKSSGNPISAFLGCADLSVATPSRTTAGAPPNASYLTVSATCQMALLTPILPFRSTTVSAAAQALIVPSS